MKVQQFTVLARRSRTGDSAAWKKLLMESYMRISYQCRHILLNQSAAETVTRDILRILNDEVDTLKHSRDFVGRMQGLIAERMAEQQNRQIIRKVKPVQLSGKLLDECQTAELIVQIVDALSWEQRLCAVLAGCGEMEVEEISAHTGIPMEKIQENLEQAELAVNRELQQFREQGIKLLGFGSMKLMLSTAMEVSRNEMTAAAVAETIMGTIRPKKLPYSGRKKNPKKEKQKATALIAAILVLVIALIAAVAFALSL